MICSSCAAGEIMKKLVSGLILSMFITSANAFPPCNVVDCGTGDGLFVVSSPEVPACFANLGDLVIPPTCYRSSSGLIFSVPHCSCGTGQIATATRISASQSRYGCSYDYYTCQGSTGGLCSACPAPCNQWQVYDESHEMAHTDTLQGAYPGCECIEQYAYRCRAGYYRAGLGRLGEPPTCTVCPGLSTAGGTSAAGAAHISGCYIPANAPMDHPTGTYTFSNDCYYLKEGLIEGPVFILP